jgi:ankyrin repeat protein
MMSGTATTAQLLLAHGADVHIRTASGNTCLHIAA